MKITNTLLNTLIQHLKADEGSECDVSFVLTNSEDENDWISMRLKDVGTVKDIVNGVRANHCSHIVLFLEEG